MIEDDEKQIFMGLSFFGGRACGSLDRTLSTVDDPGALYEALKRSGMFHELNSDDTLPYAHGKAPVTLIDKFRQSIDRRRFLFAVNIRKNEVPGNDDSVIRREPFLKNFERLHAVFGPVFQKGFGAFESDFSPGVYKTLNR